MVQEFKRANRCLKCNKIIAERNKSKLCNAHFQQRYYKNNRKTLLKNENGILLTSQNNRKI